jgi:UTP--glucose-1-phosphate uridylyltransferase
MLPASKVIPKELLPVIDTPAIQIVVEEIVASGINEIGVVVSPKKALVLSHFQPASDLEAYLTAKGKRGPLVIVQRTNDLANLTEIVQPQPLGLGDAVLKAREFIGSDPFAVLLPDDIFDCPSPCLRQLLDAFEKIKSPVVALLRVAMSEVQKYGVVKPFLVEGRLHLLEDLVEKVQPDRAPSNLAIMGRYVLTPDIFDVLEGIGPGEGGEIQLTDALKVLREQHDVYGYEFEGTRYDLGDRLGFLAAQIGFGLKRRDLADGLRAYLRSIIEP